MDGEKASFRSDIVEEDVPPLVASLIDTQSFVCDVSLVRRIFDSRTVDQVLAMELPGKLMDDFV